MVLPIDSGFVSFIVKSIENCVTKRVKIQDHVEIRVVDPKLTICELSFYQDFMNIFQKQLSIARINSSIKSQKCLKILVEGSHGFGKSSLLQ